MTNQKREKRHRSKEKHILRLPPHLPKTLPNAPLQKLRPTNKHHRITSAAWRSNLTLEQRPIHPPPAALPLWSGPTQRMHNLTPSLLPVSVLPPCKLVDFLPTQNVLLRPIPIQHRTKRLVPVILQHRPQHRENGRDSTPCTDHDEPSHVPFAPAHRAPAPPQVLELPHGALELDPMAQWQRVQRHSHGAAPVVPIGARAVDLDQHVKLAPSDGPIGIRGVGPDDDLAGYRVTEAE